MCVQVFHRAIILVVLGWLLQLHDYVRLRTNFGLIAELEQSNQVRPLNAKVECSPTVHLLPRQHLCRPCSPLLQSYQTKFDVSAFKENNRVVTQEKSDGNISTSLLGYDLVHTFSCFWEDHPRHLMVGNRTVPEGCRTGCHTVQEECSHPDKHLADPVCLGWRNSHHMDPSRLWGCHTDRAVSCTLSNHQSLGSTH